MLTAAIPGVLMTTEVMLTALTSSVAATEHADAGCVDADHGWIGGAAVPMLTVAMVTIVTPATPKATEGASTEAVLTAVTPAMQTGIEAIPAMLTSATAVSGIGHADTNDNDANYGKANDGSVNQP